MNNNELLKRAFDNIINSYKYEQTVQMHKHCNLYTTEYILTSTNNGCSFI